ncbi:MAG: hypothetical protein H7125_18465 [Proteobacteria bacterium]|nr:hypothetical protein [Burkholderiales bacterium]
MNARIAVLLIVLLIGACSRAPDYPITKTVTVSATRLAEIRSRPYFKRYREGVGPTARLGGLDDDSWPAGVLFLELDPYLEDLGFALEHMIARIDGTPVNDIFIERWRKKRIKRPEGFHSEHYRDLIEFLFLEHDKERIVLTVYVGVPRSSTEVRSYSPRVEH